ncbi:hypothetical protein L7F22_030030 [Adiantum nelumboides]|nr:hypothetical protein [Adiantum nelumboides]
MRDFMPLNTEEESNLALKKKASKARKRKQKAKIALSGTRPLENKTSIVYVGRIPHGFYEEQMRGFFGQFGTIKRLRMSRNKKDLAFFSISDFVHTCDLSGELAGSVLRATAEAHQEASGACHGSQPSKTQVENYENILRYDIVTWKRSWTGKSKHFAFIEFESPEVAEIVADSMNNYLLYEHLLQVKLVPLERVHHRMWVGSGRVYKPPNFKWLASIKQNRERKPEEQRHMLKAVLRRENKRRKRIKDAGIDFEYPDLRASLPARPKKIKFSKTNDVE